MSSLKSNVDKLDVDKLATVPSDLKFLKPDVDKLDAYNLKPIHVNLNTIFTNNAMLLLLGNIA